MDFHHAAAAAANVNVGGSDPYANVSAPFQTGGGHYNHLVADRNAVLRQSARDDSFMGSANFMAYDTRRSAAAEYMNSVRRQEVSLYHGSHHMGFALEQDTSGILGLHHTTNPPPLPGLEDVSQVM